MPTATLNSTLIESTMFVDNYFSRIHRRLLMEIVSAMKSTDMKAIDGIPARLRPLGGTHSRCCVHCDRAIIRNRCLALLGFGLEELNDDDKPLSDYAVEAMSRIHPSHPPLTFIHEACGACVSSHFQVTNACHGCFARPCVVNCPREAIAAGADGKAVVDPAKCVKCGRCVQVCPYHAVVRIPIPCEEACPVGAISKADDGKQRIDYAKCVYCGRCAAACPFGAVMEKSQVVDVFRLLQSGRLVMALLAPAAAGQFGVTMESLGATLRGIGFSEAVEVASGADETAVMEAAEFERRMAAGEKLMTSSCCTAYFEAVRKHVPGLAHAVSETPTPMLLTARRVKAAYPDAAIVFIGPCVAKRHEALASGEIDYVMTFAELTGFFEGLKVDMTSMGTPVCSLVKSRPLEAVADSSHIHSGDRAEAVKPTAWAPFKQAHWQGRGFPMSGGITEAVRSFVRKGVDFHPILVDGLDAKGMNQLRVFAKGVCPGNFVEVMACKGGCVAGPAVHTAPEDSASQITRFVESTRESTESKPCGQAPSNSSDLSESMASTSTITHAM